MSTKHLLDPELHPLADAPAFQFSREMLPAFRVEREQQIRMGDADAAGVTRQEITVPGNTGPDVRCLLYTPAETNGTRPGYLHIHGGGYIMGSPEGSDPMNISLCSKLGIVILSVAYRLAPEHPIPAPLDDCYAALGWLHKNADSLKVDRSRIAIGGESAGGGLAAAVAIHARDIGDYAICHQHLTYPMIDNLTGTPGHEGDPLVGEFIWTRESNKFGWESFLGDAPPTAPQVPSRLKDYNGLPSTWMFTASMDLFRDENITYAKKLWAAGVPTELVVYPGACHGFQMMLKARVSRRFTADHRDALARALGL